MVEAVQAREVVIKVRGLVNRFGRETIHEGAVRYFKERGWL